MSSLARFFLGGVVALLGLGALFLAAQAKSGALYEASLLIAIFAAAYDLLLIKRSYDVKASRHS